MAKIEVQESAGQLKLIKDRAVGIRNYIIVTAVGVGAILLGLFFIFVLGGPGFLMTLVGVVLVIIGGQTSWRIITKGEDTVFDRQNDSVIQNDRPLAKISDLKGIEVQHYSRHSKQGRAYFDRYFIYLDMPDGKKTEVDSNTDLALVEQVAGRIASYTGLTLQHTEEINQESLSPASMLINRQSDPGP